jgi:hypothetical protein
MVPGVEKSGIHNGELIRADFVKLVIPPLRLLIGQGVLG